MLLLVDGNNLSQQPLRNVFALQPPGEMQSAIALILGLSLAALAYGLLSAKTRWVAFAAGSVLIYSVALIAWWFAMLFEIVEVDQWLARFGVYRSEGPAGVWIFFAPPVVPVLLFLWAYLRSR